MDRIKEYADYCLNCKTKPCKSGCPLGNDIPAFIEKIKNEEYKEAFEVLENTSVLFSLCGVVCPHSKQCQGSCIRGIKSEPVQIGKLEAFIGEFADKNNLQLRKCEKKKTKKVAVIGSGPAGLTASAFLAKHGYNVTIYEKEEKLGGILRYGIPEFRLDKAKLDIAIKRILNLGIEAKCSVELGKDITLNKLRKEYDAVFLGMGANISIKMGIEGEDKQNVFGGNELLQKSDYPNFENKKVIIVGGGNVAMDIARTVKKLGAKEVTIVYRRGEEQMPAERKEIEEAKAEGVKFLYKTNIQRILGKESVEKVECIKTKLVYKDGETRAYPVNIKNSEFFLEADYVIMAVGAKLDVKLMKDMNVVLDRNDNIIVAENYMTNLEGVFAAGNIIGEKATVAWASKSGREAVNSIEKWLEDGHN